MSCHILYVVLTVHLPSAQSLKDKRRHIKSIKDRVHQQFNASIAEIDYLNEWQKSVMGIVMISNDRQYLEKQLNSIQTLLLQQHEVQLLDIHVEWL
ncbi:MAG: DUF503 domain-containing protein [Gammaproteobacteria bacterium]|nr:MAG: DUF503 domain-containing protein [Gammaproteobacteria bacterium]